MDDNKDYSNSDLGYQDNTAGPGKEQYKAKAGKDNAHPGNKARQDGVNSKPAKENAGDCVWDQDDSEGDFSDESREY